jgi:hypothetical protein
MGLQLCVGCRGVAASIADIGPLAGVRALVVVFGLVGGEGLGAGWVAAGVWAVAGVAEQVPRELGALLEVFGAGVTGLPLAEARGAVVDVRGFGVFVECFGRGEGGEAEDVGGVLPGDC